MKRCVAVPVSSFSAAPLEERLELQDAEVVDRNYETPYPEVVKE